MCDHGVSCSIWGQVFPWNTWSAVWVWIQPENTLHSSKDSWVRYGCSTIHAPASNQQMWLFHPKDKGTIQIVLIFKLQYARYLSTTDFSWHKPVCCSTHSATPQHGLLKWDHVWLTIKIMPTDHKSFGAILQFLGQNFKPSLAPGPPQPQPYAPWSTAKWCLCSCRMSTTGP